MPEMVCGNVLRNSQTVTHRVGYRLDLNDSGAKPILLKRFRVLNGARTDTFFKIKSKTKKKNIEKTATVLQSFYLQVASHTELPPFLPAADT